MLGAIILVSAISFYQDSRSKKALEALKAFTQASATVIRNNKVVELLSEELVVGDVVVVSEGELIPVDGKLLQMHDFSVNESILTGEAFVVYKEVGSSENNQVFQGSLVQSGQCVFETTAVGGQAVWNGTDYNGRRANSGVYLVFGTGTANIEVPTAIVTKILIVQ